MTDLEGDSGSKEHINLSAYSTNKSGAGAAICAPISVCRNQVTT